ncbi:MAG: glycosyltransferase [Bacteroidales bacterium]|nr:glycosyltransferase [Bacteroidales bacterium]
MPKVSVVIPVFKVQSFVERCAVSLMEQTLEDVEFIFVDDASPDSSMDIVRDVISRYPSRNARIITHEKNKGLPSARNTGLAEASGDFIYHCDSDDWVDTTILEKMYGAAMESGADFVYCDFFLSFEKNERYMSNPTYSSPEDVLTKGFLSGSMKFNVWNKLVKRSLYTDNGIIFPDGHGMGEDMTMIQIVSQAKQVDHVAEGLYHYVKLNTAAFSNTTSEKHLVDIKYNVDRTVNYLQKEFGDKYEKEISLFKLSIKLPFIISNDKAQYKMWSEWYPEANRYILSNDNMPFRTKVLQWMASKKLWLGVRLYYLLVYRFVYGILYR